METPLVQIMIGQVADGEQRLEVWVTTGKTPDGGRTVQRVVDVPVKICIPTRED